MKPTASLPLAEREAAIRRTIARLGTAFGHAYLVAPSNTLTPEIPFENLEALFEACHQPS